MSGKQKKISAGLSVDNMMHNVAGSGGEGRRARWKGRE